MSIQYLIDENVTPFYKRQLLKKNTEIQVYAVGDPGCPSRGTLDPEILSWCEENQCILVTNNRHLCLLTWQHILRKDITSQGYSYLMKG